MKRNLTAYFALAIIILMTSILSGCQALSNLANKVPEKYLEGIKYDRDFPDDTLEIYDDAIVFDSRSLFDEIVLTFGSEDSVDDIIDFYMDLFEDNEITILESEESRDEYYARGTFEDYEFKIKIEESDGEYVEDLFDTVVYISAKESDNKSLDTAPTATPSTQTSPTATPKPTNEATATPQPTQDNSGETPLSYLDTGSWEMVALYVDDMQVNAEATMQIYYDGSGVFYYYDYESDERGFYDVYYELSGGVLELGPESGYSTYKAYYDDGILHLEDQDQNVDMYFTNWNYIYNLYPKDYEFSAYGNWIYYEPEKGYVETIAFWPDSSGYIYNWGGSGINQFMYWDFEAGMFNIYDDLGNEYTYGIVHNGEVFELHQTNGSVFFYNRVSGNYWLAGNFYMDDTNDTSVSDWAFSLYSDGTMEYTLNGYTEQSFWELDKASGKIAVDIGGTYFYFDYHYYLEGLYLWDTELGLYYHFLAVG